MRTTWSLVAALLATPIAVEPAPPVRTVTRPVDAIVETGAGLAGGTMTVECSARGTTLRFSLSGLVPDGSYSLWLFVFATSRAGATPGEVTAAGALGRGDGRSHEFRADTWGRAELVVMQPEGRLSAFGAVRGCLADVPQWRVVGGHHPRRVRAGTRMPAGGEIVEHFGVSSGGVAQWSTN